MGEVVWRREYRQIYDVYTAGVTVLIKATQLLIARKLITDQVVPTVSLVAVLLIAPNPHYLNHHSRL